MWLLRNLVTFMSLAVIVVVVISGLSGRWDLWNVWAYAGMLGALALSMTLGNYRTRPDLLQERLQPPTGGRVRVPSSRAGPVMLILQWIVAGLDQRFHWTDTVPPAGMVAGLVIVALSMGLFTWAALVNPFFSSVTRIQEERGQRVVSAGPYAIVRHPAYAGLILYSVGGGLALNSLLSIIPIVALLLPITVYQTMIEDRMLRDELAGYADYAAEVHYRLIPGLW